jgi:hypothetical protein
MFDSINIWLAFHEPVGSVGHAERFEREEWWECIDAIAVKARFEDWLRIQLILAVNVDNASVGGFAG